MAQNVNDSIFRLELEVIGANTIKDVTDSVQRYGTAIKSIGTGEIRTRLTAEDQLTPVLKRATLSVNELNEAIERAAGTLRSFASIQTRNLGMVPAGMSIAGTPGMQRMLPGDLSAAIGLNLLYKQLQTAAKQLNRAMQTQVEEIEDEIAAKPDLNRLYAGAEANRALRNVVTFAPRALGPGIQKNPNFQVLATAVQPNTLIPPQDVDKSLAELAPIVAQQLYGTIFRAAIRSVAAGMTGAGALKDLEICN